MARKTFFSFHYNPDVQRAQVVRKSQFFKDHGEVGFYDASAFEKARNENLWMTVVRFFGTLVRLKNTQDCLS